MNPEIRKCLPAGLGPVLSAAGVFIHPIAITLLPFIIFLLTRNRPDNSVSLAALRATDFAFSVYLFFFLKDLVIFFLATIQATAHLATQGNVHLVTSVLLYFLLTMLAVGTLQAVRCKPFRYPLSFRLAERILIQKK